jgi:hypothetical protein
MARTTAARSRPQVAASKKAMPISPPLEAVLRSWASLRLRALSQVPFTPV